MRFKPAWGKWNAAPDKSNVRKFATRNRPGLDVAPEVAPSLSPEKAPPLDSQRGLSSGGMLNVVRRRSGPIGMSPSLVKGTAIRQHSSHEKYNLMGGCNVYQTSISET